MLTSTVKRGSKVAVSGTREGTYKLVQVECVSSKHIFVMGGLDFNCDGTSPRSTSSLELHDVTPEIEAIVLRETRIANLKAFRWEHMSDEFLGDIDALLKSKGFDIVSGD